MNNLYKKQVALLIRIMPSVYLIKDFAVHGVKVSFLNGYSLNLYCTPDSRIISKDSLKIFSAWEGTLS